MDLNHYSEEFLKLIPEIIILLSICVFTIFGLVYERSKNLPQVSKVITNMSLVVLSFILFYLIFFLNNFSLKISAFNFRLLSPLVKLSEFV